MHVCLHVWVQLCVFVNICARCVCVCVSSQSVHRDFTYIDDVVDGIMLALDHLPLRCGEVFNIGHATPHSLETLVGHLEEELGRRANKVRGCGTWSPLLDNNNNNNNGLHYYLVVMVMHV